MELYGSKRKTAYEIAATAFSAFDPSSIAKIVGVLDTLTKGIDWNELSYFDAEFAFYVFRQKVAALLEAEDCHYIANIETALESLGSEATLYFSERIVSDTKSDHVGDILVKMEELLDDEYISIDFRKALESVKEGCEKKIERQRKRAKIREDLKMFDEPEVIGPQKKVDPAEGDVLIGKPKLSVDQFIMLMFAIGGSRFLGLDKKAVAEGLSALTGNSVKQFTKRFSEVLQTENGGIKKFCNQTDAYNKDVVKVCEILTKMGLSDEVYKLKQNSNA